MGVPERIGRYEVIRQLGEGGMGRVYLARDTVLGREVAVKVLRDDLGLSPEVKQSLHERMKNEARAAATVRHPNLVTLHDMGEDEDGLYLVFEYVQGPTLRDKLANGALPPIDVARIAMELGAALTTAHEAGVIHRDVKPENIILSSTGAVLTDFGLARMPDSTLTTKGMVLGTVGYSAPETLAGGKFSPASDQFSLAATLYEALCGKRAFQGDDLISTAAMVATEDPRPLQDVVAGRPVAPGMSDTELDFRVRIMLGRADGVVRRALSKSPGDRYPSCRVFCESLSSAIDVRVSSGFPALSGLHSASIVPKATRRWQNIFVGAALTVILALVVFGREQPAGVSLKAVASSFSATIAPEHAPEHVQHNGEHHARPTSSEHHEAPAQASADAGAAADAHQLPQPFLEVPPPNGPKPF
ncbi:MAG TPA: serine/threonine-protein kinase [Polyangiaceae bacterium]|nr:serine/threonine-protein kinase [Polyangiaceae bacterium]